MKNPKIKTEIAHSQTKAAWNIIGKDPGGKYKIARIPYCVTASSEIIDKNRIEAFQHAEFISHCFNNSDYICI